MQQMTIAGSAKVPSVWTYRHYPVTDALPDDLGARTTIVRRYYRRSAMLKHATNVGMTIGGFGGSFIAMALDHLHHPGIAVTGMVTGMAVSVLGILRAVLMTEYDRLVPATTRQVKDATELVASLERLVVAMKSRRESDVQGAFQEASLLIYSLAGNDRLAEFRNDAYSNGGTRRHWHQDDADESIHIEQLSVGRLYRLLGEDGQLTESARGLILRIVVAPMRQIGLMRGYDVAVLAVEAIDPIVLAGGYGWATLLDEAGSRALARIREVEGMMADHSDRFAETDRHQLRTLFDHHLPELGTNLVEAWREATEQERPDLVREIGATLELVRASVDSVEDHARPARQRLQDSQRFLAYRHAPTAV